MQNLLHIDASSYTSDEALGGDEFLCEPGLSRLPTHTPCSAVYEITKRGLDILIASVVLLAFLPLWLLLGVAIRLDSSGPAMIKQRRIGRERRRGMQRNGHLFERRNGHDYRGQPFFIYKFRTMRADAELYAIKPHSRNDERITRVGRIVRRLCLDEAPQLLNVFKGEMSIVGPRPEMPFIVARYNDIEARRLLVKPGLTGLWQLYGSRRRHIHEQLYLDLHYINNRGLWLDARIMMKTAQFILSMRNI